jgi:hypothetical protein
MLKLLGLGELFFMHTIPKARIDPSQRVAGC